MTIKRAWDMDMAEWKVYVTKDGWRTSKRYPWTKMVVGDWFFVPFHKTKSSLELGRCPTIMRVRALWGNTKRQVTWVPGIKSWGMTITVALHPRLDNKKGRLGVLVRRVL